MYNKRKGVNALSTGVFEDLTGQQFGFLTVLERAPGRPKGNGKLRTMWRCECECGSITDVAASHLKSRHNISCGCKKSEFTSKLKCEDMTGRRFGRLTVIQRADDYVRPNGRKDTQWVCECDCGNTTIKRSAYLKKSKCPSCGCRKKEVISDVKSSDLSGQRFGMLTVLSYSHTAYTSGGNPVRVYNCVCDCGREKLARSSSLLTGSVQSCGCHKFSSGERAVNNILEAFGVTYEREYAFKDLRGKKHPLRFDFALFNADGSIACLVEYQGPQHYMQTGNDEYDFGKQQRDETDARKREYCATHHITLCEIPYNENITTEVIRIIATHVNPVPSIA